MNDGAKRFAEAERDGKKPIIIYFGDYDASGEDIPRSIFDNMKNDFGVNVEVKRVALMEEQVIEWGLPPAPTKDGDSRGNNWDGLGQVELDAVSPSRLKTLLREGIESVFDFQKWDVLQEREREERALYKNRLKEFVVELSED